MLISNLTISSVYEKFGFLINCYLSCSINRSLLRIEFLGDASVVLTSYTPTVFGFNYMLIFTHSYFLWQAGQQ